MGWDQLRAIIEDNQKIAEETKPITECPDCGFTGLKENKNKDLLCPICGWTGRR